MAEQEITRADVESLAGKLEGVLDSLSEQERLVSRHN